jgi:hypothetical protein
MRPIRAVWTAASVDTSSDVGFVRQQKFQTEALPKTAHWQYFVNPLDRVGVIFYIDIPARGTDAARITMLS